MWDLLLYAAIGYGIYRIIKFAKAGAEDFGTAVSMGGEHDYREKDVSEQVSERAGVGSMGHK